MPNPLHNPLFRETGSIEVKITFGQYPTASNAYIAYAMPEGEAREFLVPRSLEEELEQQPNFASFTASYKAKWLLFKMLERAVRAK